MELYSLLEVTLWQKLYMKELYSLHGPKVSYIRKDSIKEYIGNSCNKDVGSKKFYNTLKLYISSKSSSNNGNRIILRDNEKVVSNPIEVANIFNEYFASIAEYSDIYDGLDELSLHEAIQKHADHDSIQNIKDNVIRENVFHFYPVTSETIKTYISKLQTNKAVGYDGIHPMFLKLSSNNMHSSLAFIFNKCILNECFPDSLKMAEICPIFKKKDCLSKENYRSVNILAAASKIFERIMADQIITYFNSILSSSV